MFAIILYIIIFVASILIAFILNATLAVGMPVWYALVASVSNFAIIFALDTVVATIIHALPVKWFSPKKTSYKLTKGKKRFLKIIGVRTWKNLVPDMGKLCDFDRQELQSTTDVKYIRKFLTETNYAQIIHISMALIGFLDLLIWPSTELLNFSLPFAIFNFFINMPSIIIQMYNRPRLYTLYKYALRHQN